MKRQENYCDGCYSAASKAGRVVRSILGGIYCPVCESRKREGLVHYRPSNGTEFDIFYSRCERCRHNIDDADNPQPGRLQPPFNCCTWGILDRFFAQMAEEDDHISNWFQPTEIERDGCPATCLRYTHKSDPDGNSRDPAPIPDPAQMTFADLFVVEEKIIQEVQPCPAPS